MAVTAAERGKQLSLQVVTAQSVAETQDSNTHWIEIAIIEGGNYELEEFKVFSESGFKMN